MMADVGVNVWQVEKAVQTDDDKVTHHKLGLLSEEARPTSCLFTISNTTYNSDSEDSLCRIEHAPLDGFLFPQARGQRQCRPETVEPRSAEDPSVDLTHITVRADINYKDCKDVTVV